MSNVSNVANVANVAGSGGDFDGAAFWRRLAAAGGGGGVIELGAGETGLVGLMAAKLLQCHCSSGPGKGSEWHVATCGNLPTSSNIQLSQETCRAYCEAIFSLSLFLRLSY